MYDAEWFQSCLQWFTKGFTFLEAFEHSGRVLNITCTCCGAAASARLLMLNHVETPHIDIASAVCASSAVPGLIEAVTLKEKAPDGTLREYHHLDLTRTIASASPTALRVGPAAARAGRRRLPVHDRVAGEPHIAASTRGPMDGPGGRRRGASARARGVAAFSSARSRWRSRRTSAATCGRCSSST